MMKKITAPFQWVAHRLTQSSNAIVFGLIALLVVIGPLFFIPVLGMSIVASKGYFFILLAIIGVLISGITLLKRGGASLPKHPIFLVLLAMVVFSFIGTLFAPAFGMSFWGYGFGTTTWIFTALFAVITLLGYKAVVSYERIGLLYGGLFGAFIILAILHIIRFIAGPATANLLVLGTTTSTLVGSWSDLGIFAAVVLILSMITLQLAGLKQFFKGFVVMVSVISALFLLAMNITTLWIIIGFVSLLLTLYLFAFAYWDTKSKAYKKEKRVPWYLFTLFTLSVAALFFGGIVNHLAVKHQNITWNDVRPSLVMTTKVAGKSIAHNFATGYGPNSFPLGWSLSKPVQLSGTSVADTGFTLGFSYVTSQIAMNGILGALAWIFFFGIIVVVILKRLGQGFEHGLDRYFVVSLGTIILFLGIVAWVMVPGSYALVLFAILTGTFIKMFVPSKDFSFSFIKDPRASFFGILGVTVMIIGTIIGGYVIVRKAASFVVDTRGLVLINQGKLQEATQAISLAQSYASHDMYHAQLTQLALSDVAKLTQTINSNTSNETASKQAEQVLGIALGHAKVATTVNPQSYKNWILLGDVYRAAVALNVAGAYDLAKTAYQEASRRNPNDATMDLTFANLELANKNVAGALTKIQGSLDKRPTRDAYLLRAQILMSQGKWSDVVSALKQAILLDQNNPRLYVYLGVAYEKAGDQENANSVYALIRNRFADGDDAIAQVRSALNAGAPLVTPTNTIDATSSASTTSAAGTVKTPVAPKPKR